MSTVIETLEKRDLKQRPKFGAGDRVRVHFQVVEGNRKRTQVFEGIVLKREINVALPIDLGEQGLIVPVIKNADGLSFIGLNRAIADLALEEALRGAEFQA